MPIGLVMMRWDIKVSTEILAKYPEELIISEETLMQIYAAHEYTGEPGMISLLVGPLNFALHSNEDRSISVGIRRESFQGKHYPQNSGK